MIGHPLSYTSQYGKYMGLNISDKIYTNSKVTYILIWVLTTQQVMSVISIFKPGARQLQAGVRLVSRNHFRAAKVCVCVCVCVRPPPRL